MIIAVVNQKGGVAKSTSALALSVIFGHMGYKVLTIDCDPQTNCSLGFGLTEEDITKSTYDILKGVPVSEVIKPNATDNVDLVPSHIELALAEVELAAAMAGELKLKNALARVADQYDFIILDCPPSLGLLTTNCLTAADKVIVPISAQPFAFQGLKWLERTVENVKQTLNPNCRIDSIFMTIYDQRHRMETELMEMLQANYSGVVAENVIPKDIRLGELGYHQDPTALFEHTRGSDAYRNLAKELITKWQNAERVLTPSKA